MVMKSLLPQQGCSISDPRSVGVMVCLSVVGLHGFCSMQLHHCLPARAYYSFELKCFTDQSGN